MNWESRSVETCPYRREDREDRSFAGCGLLGQIVGTEDPTLQRVPRDACVACCRSFPPTAVDPNPVIASLAFGVAQRMARDGDARQDRLAQAARLRDWTLQFLPLMRADEPEASALPDTQSTANGPDQPIEQTVPLPAEHSGGTVRDWAVGVTTAPRRLPTLSLTLRSLAKCGWQDAHLFIDDAVDVPPEFQHLDYTRHRSATGAFPNYHLALLELYHRNPDADAYMMVQDDVLLYEHPALRRYLQSALWPSKRPCVVSLFCSQLYARDQPGWYAFDGQWLWGAQLFIFSPPVLRALLGSQHLLEHRTESDNGLALIDHCIGKWAAQQGVPIYFPTPSLAQHIGHISTLWQTSRIVGGRRAAPFAGDLPGKAEEGGGVS